MKYEILTPGQKIRKLRKKLGATQQDIVGNEYSRNTLTMIETHKQKLTYETARVISDNINLFAKNKGINIGCITADYLLESFDVQCDKIAEKYIKELDAIKLDNNINRFMILKKEVDEFLSDYENYIFAARRFSLNYLLGENLLRLYKYDEAYLYSYKAYDDVMTINDPEKKIKVIALMIGICYRLNRMTEILALGIHALNLVKVSNINDSVSLAKVYYNLALAYKKNGKYMDCFELLEKVLRLPDIDRHYAMKAKILKANCYTENKDYDTAEKLHLKILEEAKLINDINSIAYTYWNLGYVNLKKGNCTEAEFYADHLVYLDGKNDTEQLANNMYWASYIYKEIDNYESVKRYLYRSLSLLYKVNNYNAYLDLFDEVLNYFIGKNHFKDIEELIKKVSEDIYSGEFPKHCKDVIVGKLYKGLTALNINKVHGDNKELFHKIIKLDC